MRKRELSEKDDLIMSRPRLQCSGTIKFLCLYNAHTYNLYLINDEELKILSVDIHVYACIICVERWVWCWDLITF